MQGRRLVIVNVAGCGVGGGEGWEREVWYADRVVRRERRVWTGRRGMVVGREVCMLFVARGGMVSLWSFGWSGWSEGQEGERTDVQQLKFHVRVRPCDIPRCWCRGTVVFGKEEYDAHVLAACQCR